PLSAYALLYAWGLGWRAAALSGFVAASAGTGEAMAWGGYPQLIGLGLLMLFVLALDRFLTSQTIWGAFAPAGLLLAVLATTDLIGAIAVVVGVAYLVSRYTFFRINHDGNSARNVLLGLGLGIGLASLM